MFTGLIEDLGRVKYCGGGRLSIWTKLDDIEIGDSINVEGACLTVVEQKDEWITFDLSSETRWKTNLGRIVSGGKVNLERAIKLGERLGGHLVTGHIDGVGIIKKRIIREGNSLFEIACGQDLLECIVPKGSVALDGVSLTVISVDSSKSRFSVGIIPHTQKQTTFGFKKEGDKINIEVDILSRYSKKFSQTKKNNSGLTRAFLEEKGWL